MLICKVSLWTVILFLSLLGIDIGLIITLNVEQFEDVEGYANQTGILVGKFVLFSLMS